MKLLNYFILLLGICLFSNALEAQIGPSGGPGFTCTRCDTGACDTPPDNPIDTDTNADTSTNSGPQPNGGLSSTSNDLLDEVLPNSKLKSVNSNSILSKSRSYIPFLDKALKVNIYPNPFRLNTTIKYELEEDTRMLVELYDSHGRKVKTLFSDYQTNGIHELSLQGFNLEKGTYFCLLNIGDTRKTYPIIKL